MMLTSFYSLLAFIQDEDVEEAAEGFQSEYMMVYALVFAMVFLGFLAIGIPRLRKTTIADDSKKKKK